MEKVYSKIRKLLECNRTANYQPIIDLLGSVDLTTDVKDSHKEISSILSKLTYGHEMHPADCCYLVRNVELYEYVLSRGINVGYFAVSLALFVGDKYNIKVTTIPTLEDFDVSDEQDVYNIIIKNISKYLGVFYDGDLHRCLSK